MINAAHPSPILWRADSGSIIEFPATGMALGMFEDLREGYSLLTEKLNRGDRLFLYSDGLTEMMHGEKEFDFKDFIAAESRTRLSEIVTKIEGFVRVNHQERPLADDITLIDIEYLGKKS